MKQRTERIVAATLALLPALAWAQQSPSAAVPTQVAAAQPAAQPSKLDQTKDQLTKLPSAADLRPNGPLTISANHAELTQGNTAVYTGNVTLDSDTLKMDGDRVELKRAADGQYTAKVTGAPAHMSHAGNGPDNPPMTARAKTMIYDSRAGAIDLAGDALMTRGNDQTKAETIRYYLLEQRYEASGGDSGNGRVTIVLPQVSAPGPGSTPAQTAPAAAPPVQGGVQPGPTPAAPQGPVLQQPAPAPKASQQNGPKP